MEKLAAIVLAAGKGKRMNSELPKVLHEMFGRPMVEHLLNTLIAMGIKDIAVVIGHQAELVKERLEKFNFKVDWILQEKQLGTGHAVMVTADKMQDFDGDMLVLAGDVPFLSRETIEKLIEIHRREKAAVTVLSAEVDDPEGYGRVIRKKGTDLLEYIVEHKDASEEERKVNEINTAIMVFDNRYLFPNLNALKDDNAQKEYYLTDMIEILGRKGLKTAVYKTDNPDEALGVNSVEQKAELEARFAKKL